MCGYGRNGKSADDGDSCRYALADCNDPASCFSIDAYAGFRFN